MEPQQEKELNQEKEVVIINDLSARRPSQEQSARAEISVEEPLLQDKSFFSYKVVGVDLQGPFAVRRRYSDFDLLRRRLAQRWLGVYLPPISGKRAENNPRHLLRVFESTTPNQEKYAETRRRFLHYFCQGIAARPYLYYCDVFQAFLRGGPDFETILAATAPKEYSFLLHAYQEAFGVLIAERGTVDPALLVAQNDRQLAALRQSEITLQGICEKIYQATEARESLNAEVQTTLGRTLPTYEEKCLLKHADRDRNHLLVTRSETFAQEGQRLRENNNPLELFLEMVMYEIREVKSFIEAIEGRREAERRRTELKDRIRERQAQRARLEGGSFSLRALLKTGSRQLQINELAVKVEIYRNELNCLDKMLVGMLLSCDYELAQFRLRRGREYAQVFKRVAELEVTQISALQTLIASPLLGLA